MIPGGNAPTDVLAYPTPAAVGKTCVGLTDAAVPNATLVFAYEKSSVDISSVVIAILTVASFVPVYA
ncbi:MAG: hypothetical protein KAG66_14920, partial [Methylococcales bacterium]|nr:hypothetical protein [Methylococcales bacterium]